MKKKILLGTIALSLILAGCGYMSDADLKKQDHIVIVHDFPNNECESLTLEIVIDDIAKNATGKDIHALAHTERANSVKCSTYGKINDNNQCIEDTYDGSVDGYPKGDKSCIVPYEINK